MQSLLKRHEYFPNLNGLRFIGALSIILLHIEDVKKIEHKQAVWWIRYFNVDGGHLVSLFFVLSGFLITYLLLKEKSDNNAIDIKKFYVRRILRIWPLYYLIGIVGFFVFPLLGVYFYGSYDHNMQNHCWLHFLLYILFLHPFTVSHFIGAAWSVRVEEAFYLVWPAALNKTKRYVMLFVIVIILTIAVRNFSFLLLHYYHIRALKIASHLATDYRFSCMAMGAIAAYIYIQGKLHLLNILYSKKVQYAVYMIILLLFLFRVNIPGINFEFYSVFFAIMVLNLATNPQSVLKLNYNWMNYLGKISYGLYLFNPIMRNLSLELVMRVFNRDVTGWQANIALYTLTILSTVIISALSYEFFEKPFLGLKKYFV